MTRKSLMVKSQRVPRFATRKHSRCPICGRPRAYLRKFNMCRICFRKLALEGRVPGVIKASW